MHGCLQMIKENKNKQKKKHVLRLAGTILIMTFSFLLLLTAQRQGGRQQFGSDRFGGPNGRQSSTNGQRLGGQRPNDRQFDGSRPNGQQFAGQRPNGRQFDGARTEGQQFDGQRPNGRQFDGARPEQTAVRRSTPKWSWTRWGSWTAARRELAGSRPNGQQFDGQRPNGGQFDGARPELARNISSPANALMVVDLKVLARTDNSSTVSVQMVVDSMVSN